MGKIKMDKISEIRQRIADEIHEKVKYTVISNLRDIPDPKMTFDPFKVDYFVDNINTRIEKISSQLVEITMEALFPVMSKVIEEMVRDKIRKSI